MAIGFLRNTGADPTREAANHFTREARTLWNTSMTKKFSGPPPLTEFSGPAHGVAFGMHLPTY